MRSRYRIECVDCEVVVIGTDDPREAHSFAVAATGSGPHYAHTISIFTRGMVNRWRFAWANRDRGEDPDVSV